VTNHETMKFQSETAEGIWKWRGKPWRAWSASL